MSPETSERPLADVRVLAIEQMQALPYATQMLSRLGASVVKVEPPGRGESGRQALPAVEDPDGRLMGATFLRNNFNKRSIAVDLKNPDGRALVLRLAPRFDIVCQNFKAGAIDRLGLGYDDVKAVHPKVVYLSVSGFGTTDETPYSSWPAYAPVAEAMAGLYTYLGEPDTPPPVSPMGTLGDTGSALFSVIGVLAALRHRDRTGEGQHVDVAMLDAMVAMADAGVNYWSLGLKQGAKAPLINHSFRASDGWFIIQCGRMHQFEYLCRTVGHPEWLDDPRLPDPPAWYAHIDDILRPAIEQWAADKTRAEAASALAEAGVASGMVHRAEDVLEDEHVRAHRMIVSTPRPKGDGEPILAVGNPVKLSAMDEVPDTRMPWVGEHTDEVLREELDLSAADLEKLRTAGAIE
jgi:formyl-CoA transferase